LTNLVPYWYRVLSHFEKKRYIVNGLTIPFLIGSRTIVEPGKKPETIRELLTSLSESTHAVTILRCGQIKEFVIGLLDNETNSMRTQYKNMFKEFGNLLVVDDSFKNTTKFEDMVNMLEMEYEDRVQKQTFSKESGQWINFSTTDKIRLGEVT
jgi:hypothetical protein